MVFVTAEATRILEASKHVSLHRHQESDWEAVEIANLKAIAQKYERELLALQVILICVPRRCYYKCLLDGSCRAGSSSTKFGNVLFLPQTNGMRLTETLLF